MLQSAEPHDGSPNGSPDDGRKPEALLDEIREMVGACMQCGTCSASCPNVGSMDMTPRTLWRMVVLGLTDEVFASKTFWLCSSCYTCTLRCPRGLQLTAAMAALKRLATAMGVSGEDTKQRKNSAFYKAFIDNVRTWGRVQEGDLMAHYFWAMRDPLLPLSYTPLGLKMLGKGKLHVPSGAYKGRLDALFAKVREMEAGS